MQWIVLAIALTGLFLNILKRRECFILWFFSNLYWAYHNVVIGETVQAILFGVFAFFCFWGLIIWTPKKKSQLPAATRVFCDRIIAARNFPVDITKVKINWLFEEAENLLKIIEDEK